MRWIRKTLRWVGIATAVVAAMVVVAAIVVPRYPSMKDPSQPMAAARIAERMDPALLTDGLSDKVVVEFDWVEGCEPGPLTIAGLKRVLEKYGPPNRPVEMIKSDRIPRAEWDALAKTPDLGVVDALVERYANPPTDPAVEHRYVLFAPTSGGNLFGYSSGWNVVRGGARARVEGVVVFREAHARYAPPWVSLDKLERMTLIHEFGHQLGLVSDPRHERRGRHVRHCNRLDCVMSHPTARVMLHNFYRGIFDVWFTDYCDDCQAEIRAAQAEWRKERTAAPNWAAKMQARRASRGRSDRLDDLWKVHDWKGLLEAADQILADDPDARPARYYRTTALTHLGRLDDAVASLQEPFEDDASGWSTRAWLPARGLIAAGRHEDALTLLSRVMDPRGNAPDLDDYEFEQTAYVVSNALEGLGRFLESAQVLSRLLERGSQISYIPDEMKIRIGDLSRRSGALDEADRMLSPLLGNKRFRDSVVDAFYRLRVAQNRPTDARLLLEEALGSQSSIGDTPVRNVSSRAGALFERAVRLAWLSRKDEAAVALREGASLALQSEELPRLRPSLVGAYAALGQFEEAARVLRERTEDDRLGWDVCAQEDLTPMRDNVGYRDIFRHCPPWALVSSGGRQEKP